MTSRQMHSVDVTRKDAYDASFSLTGTDSRQIHDGFSIYLCILYYGIYENDQRISEHSDKTVYLI